MDEYELAGAPRAMGRQFVEQLHRTDRSLGDVSPEPLDPPPERREFAKDCLPYVEEHAPRILDELAGIATATGNDAEAVQTVPLAVDAAFGCSLVAIAGDRAPAGGPLFGRNLDFHPSFRQFSKCYRTRPDGALASIGCGFTFGGRLDGVNEAGLAIGFAGVPTDQYEPGVSWPIAIRAVLDRCRSVREATRLLEAVEHVRNVNFLLADVSGDLAVVEAGPGATRVTRPDRDFAAVTNQFPSTEMRSHQSGSRHPSDCPRLQSLETLLEDESGTISLEDLQSVMGDPDSGVCWRLDEAGDDPRSTIWSWTMALDAGEAQLARGSPVHEHYRPVEVPPAAEHT